MKRDCGLMAMFILVTVCVQTALGQASQFNATGFVTDTLSGVRGANPLHADASKRNVAAGMAVYAVYDEATKKLYVLQPQAAGATFVGQ